MAGNQKQPATSGSTASVEQLTGQVDALQARIKTLEERLEKLEKNKAIHLLSPTPEIFIPSPHFTTPPRSELGPNRPPNALGERQFNRLKYYFIPLKTKEN